MSGDGTEDAVVRITGDDKALDSALGRSRSKLSKWGKDVSSDIKKTPSGAFQGLGSLIGFGGVAGLAVAARDTLEWSRRMDQLRISTGMTAAATGKFNDQIQRVAVATGVQQAQLLAGAEKYQAITGKLSEYTGAMEDFAQIQKATSASMDDIIGVSTALTENLKIDPSQLKEVFGVLADQGKKGSVEFRQMATLMPPLLAMSMQFGDANETGAQRVREIGAAMQMLAGKTHDPNKAATLLGDMMEKIKVRASYLKAHGIEIFTDKSHTQMKDLFVLLDEIQAKIKPDQETKVFGARAEILEFLTYLRQGNAEMKDFANTGAGAADIARDAAIATNSVAGQWDKVKAQITATLNGVLLPALPKLVDAFQILANIVKFLADHPGLAIAGYATAKYGPGAVEAMMSKESSAIAAAAKIQPVEVMNWPAGFGGGGAMPSGSRELDLEKGAVSAVAAAPESRVAALAKKVAPAVFGFGGAFGGMLAGGWLGGKIGNAVGGDTGGAIGSILGGMGGMYGGAKLGTLIGARLAPFLGPLGFVTAQAGLMTALYEANKNNLGSIYDGNAAARTRHALDDKDDPVTQQLAKMRAAEVAPDMGLLNERRAKMARGESIGQIKQEEAERESRRAAAEGMMNSLFMKTLMGLGSGPLSTTKIVVEVRDGNIVAHVEDDRNGRRGNE